MNNVTDIRDNIWYGSKELEITRIVSCESFFLSHCVIRNGWHCIVPEEVQSFFFGIINVKAANGMTIVILCSENFSLFTQQYKRIFILSRVQFSTIYHNRIDVRIVICIVCVSFIVKQRNLRVFKIANEKYSIKLSEIWL